MKKFMLYALLVITPGCCITIFRSVPIPAELDYLTEIGIVNRIYEAGTKDMTFYINRG